MLWTLLEVFTVKSYDGTSNRSRAADLVIKIKMGGADDNGDKF